MSSTRDNTYTNTSKKTFYLSDDVDNESISKLMWDLLYQIREDDEKDEKEKDYKREPIKLYINSYGGSVYDMWGLIDAILNSKTPIYVFNSYNNRNYLLTRHHSYENEGRFQNEDEAKEVRKEIIDKLNQYNIKYEEIASTESNCEYIVEKVMEEIRNEQ